MKLLRLVVTIASWFALAGGLVWTGKVSVGSDPAAPLPPVLAERVVDRFEDATELDLDRAGSFPFAVGLAVRDYRDSLLVQERWTALDLEQGRIHLILDDASGEADSWTGKLTEMPIIGSLAKDSGDLLLIARGQLEGRAAGAASLRLQVEEVAPDGPTASILGRLRLVLGELRNDVETFVKRDSRPGLLLLAGIAGVFSHLFMLFGRLVIPMQANALPDDLI